MKGFIMMVGLLLTFSNSYAGSCGKNCSCTNTTKYCHSGSGVCSYNLSNGILNYCKKLTLKGWKCTIGC